MLKMEREWNHQQTFVVGEKIIWHGGSPGLGSSVEVKEGIYHGKISWIGKMREFGEKLIVGVEMDKPFKGSSDGFWQNRPIFFCKPGHGLFLPQKDVCSVDENKSKTLERSQETSNGKGLMKLKNRFSSEGNHANTRNSLGNQPGSPKPSSTKGGTIFNKGNKVTNKSSSSLETTSENFVPKRSVSANSIKKVFNTINKKEKKGPNESLSTQEIVCNSEEHIKLHRGGFLNIFKWFSKKELKAGKVSTEKMSGKGIGSTTSLVSNSSSITFFPIRHSVSADNSNTMMKSYNKDATEEKFLKHGSLRRSSGTSNHSNVSLDSFNCRLKKRPAPKPPDSVPRKNDNITPFNSSVPATVNEKSFSKEFQSSQPVYGKVKRKAPDPPKTNKSPPHIKNNAQFSSPNNSIRPLSTFSSFSSVSHSGSSTLQSSTCSENDSLTLRSDSSQNTSSFPINKDKGTLSPKPWYKRKKVKEKSYKNKKEKGKVYEAWMPDIQYARHNVNASDSTALQSKNIETFYDRGPQIGQRFSILSSISDLDRAATEQFEREKEYRSKKGKESQFYKNSSTHFLSQRDLLPNKEEELEGAVALTPDTASSANATYDNLNYSNDNGNMSTKPPHHFNSNLNNDKASNSIQIILPSAPDLDLLENSSSPNSTVNSCDTLTKINYEEYIEEIRRELEKESSENSLQATSKYTPKEKATFDPELFYQLARDAKINQEHRLNNTRKCSDNLISTKSKETENNSERSFQSRLKPHLKNFGMRMNNFFTPDVSTILEGSESITSSTATTTPADDFGDDVLNRSGMSIDQANDFMSTASELNSEYRMNTTELQDAIESYVVDLRRFEGQQKTSLTNDEYESRKEKADKIREEVLLLREKDNFLMWQKVMQETELTKEDDERSIEERKKKWVCCSCTLINHPWRLHCEACGSLRPPNPRRIDDDSVVGNYSQASHYASSSNDAASSVMQESKSGAKGSRDNIPKNSCVQNYRDNASNLNWERELQSYFTLFDDQTNSAKRQMELDKRGKMTENINNSIIHDDSGVYGKILVSRNKVSDTSESGTRFKGENKGNRFQESNVDVQELRRARVRRFQLSFSSSQEQQTIASSHNMDRENFTGSSGVKEKISQLSELSSEGHHGDGIVLENSVPGNRLKDSATVFNNIDDKQFYKNEYKKSPVLKPSGAVKSVVSIFNQMDQYKAAQEKPPPVKANRRRSSFSNIINFSDFERLITGGGTEAQRNYTPPPRTNSPVMADVDIASAINKFDEMAALAEIDNIRKPKLQKKWIKSVNLTNEVNKEGKPTDKEKLSEKNSHTQNDLSFSSKFSGNVAAGSSLNQNYVDKKISNRDSCDSIIKDGILYTSGESRRRSMSIGSGTFELLNAKDFASIEAHHSRKSSPNDDEIDAAPSVLELTHPLLMPEISSVAKPHPGNSSEKTPENVLDSESGSDVERLSQQLTDTQGIEIFKATLARDERKLGKTNAKTLSRLLKNLEHAISNGKHEEAAKLARDLAKMRLKCSVMSKDEDSDGSVEDNDTLDTQQGRIMNEGEISGAEMSACCGAVGFEPFSNNKNEGVVKRIMKSSCISRREVKSDSGGSSLLIIPAELESSRLIHVKMYVEDKASHQGPIILQLQSSITVGDLKLRVSDEFGFPVEVQRWILGRVLADDDSKTLADYKVTAEGCPIFLYLVAPDYDTNQTSPNMSRSSSYKSNGNQDSESKSELSEENIREVKQKYPSDIKIISIKTTSPVLAREVQTDRNIKIETVADQRKKVKGKREKRVKTDNEKKSGELHHPRKSNLNKSDAVGMKKVQEKGLPQQNFKPSSLTRDGWICPQCTLINPKDRPGCEACTTERPESFSNPGLKKKNLRQEVFALESKGCVTNQEPFDCVVCFSRFDIGEGVILRDCLHIFCRYCLINSIRYSDTARVRCPFSDKNYSCQFSLQEREIKDLLSEEDYKKHLDKSIKEAAGSMRNVFYCKTPDCKGFCQYEDSVNNFNCDVCHKINCLTCQAQHEKQSCKQYQDELLHKQDEEALKTKKFFDDIIRRGDGMPCPQCSIMLVRKWGCDWMRCPMCRTEICWVTRMPRWGPEGQGDTSGGCKCGINGRKCHPKCTYCH